MRFVPSTSTTFVTANSYLSIVEADEIFSAVVTSQDWAALSVANKQVLLIQGSLLLDGHNAYKGMKTDPKQALEFPRSPNKTIPPAVKFSTCLLISDSLLSATSGGGGVTGEVKSEAVGKIKTEYYSGTGNITSSTLSSADKVLNEYMRPYIRSTLRVVL